MSCNLGTLHNVRTESDVDLVVFRDPSSEPSEPTNHLVEREGTLTGQALALSKL